MLWTLIVYIGTITIHFYVCLSLSLCYRLDSNKDFLSMPFNLCIVVDIDKKWFWITDRYILSNDKYTAKLMDFDKMLHNYTHIEILTGIKNICLFLSLCFLSVSALFPVSA